MAFYVGVIDKDEAGYGVWFPDLPGCTSAGASADEIFANGRDAVRLWVEDALAEGEPLPTARDIAALLDDPEVRDAMRGDNAAFIQVPLQLKGERNGDVDLSIERELLEAIDAAARVRGLTPSAFLANALRDKIAEDR